MKSFLITLKTMTVVALSFLLAVPSGNVVLAEEEAEAPETVVEETAEEVSESETAEPEEETVVEETEEPSEEVVAEETAEPEEEVVEETEEPTEEVVAEETAEPEEEVVQEETTEPEEENADAEVTEEEAEESEEETAAEETTEPEDAVPEEEQAPESAETDNVKTEDAEINGTIANTATAITPGVETDVNISTAGAYKYFKYKPSQAGVYTFTSISSEKPDTYGYLYDSMESIIKSDDDSGDNAHFLLFCELEANVQYYFGARFFSATRTGSFKVLLKKLNEGWNNIVIDNETKKTYVSEGRLIRNQVLEIAGEPYLFDYDGFMVTNSSTEYNGKTYLIDENGHFTEHHDGWNQVGDQWFYGMNGQLVTNKVLKIGTSYYGFDYDGAMFNNTEFSMSEYDKDGNYIGYYYYRAREGGSLYVNSWYQSGSDWYYYGAEGKGAKDITKVNGTDYLFDDFGRMIVYGSRQIGDVLYIGDVNGHPVKVNNDNGWVPVGSAWFYVENKNIIRSQVRKIGNSYYGFNYQGKMYADIEFSMYSNDGNGNYHYDYYRAKSNGVLYQNEWYATSYNDWYYYGSDAKRVSGVRTINGKTYIFRDFDGAMYKNTTYSDGSKSYIIDGNGVATLLKNGWNKVNNAYYYVSGGNLYRYTVAKIDNVYYGFDPEGKMYDNLVFNLDGYYYRAKSGGALYVNSWVGNYYYGADGKGYIGDRTVNGVRYFFTYQGEAVSNRYVLAGDKLYYTNAKCAASAVTKDGLYRDILDTSTGFVSSSGVCVSGGKVLKNEWKKIDGKWYYFDAYGFYLTGTEQIGTDVYYFNSDGTMCETGWQKTIDGDDIYVYSGGALATGKKTINGKKYCFTDDGYMVTGLYYSGSGYELYGRNGQLIGSVKKGWNEISGTWYYFDGSEVYCNSVYVINGERYYFNENYVMLTDCYFDGYVFGSNGKAVKSGWAQVGAYWYYVDSATGRAFTNQIKQINGKKYRFGYNGRMQVNSFVFDSIAYTTDASGAIISEKSLKNGWELADGAYLYYKDGIPYNGWVGNYYIEDGRMLRNRVADGYWVGNDGVYNSKAGWITDAYAYGLMYAKSGGKLVKEGWEKIDGSWYYFSYYDAITMPLREGSNAYYFDVDGKLVKTVYDLSKDQWVNAGDYWGYIKNGSPVYEGKYMIDGKEYNFQGGRMQRNCLSYYYDYYGRLVTYVQSDGTTAHYNGWKVVNGRWYFFDLSSNAVIYGWINDNGKKYFIDSDGMLTGWNVVDGRLCNFGSNGALAEEVTQQNGWLAKGGNWYYFVNGEAISGTVRNISGKLYGFTYDGRLGNNELIHTSGIFFADSNGVIVKNTWKKVGSRWYYFGVNGQALSGIQRINGTVYYFNGYVLED